MPRPIDARFAELMQRYADDALGADDTQEFNALLREDADLRDAFVGYCLHAQLTGEVLERDEAPAAQVESDAAPVIAKIEPTRRGWVAPAAVAAGLLLCAAVVAVVLVAMRDDTPVEPRWTGAPVAVLTDSVDVRWVDDVIATGDQLPPRPIRTSAGRVGIQFDSGASLATQGASELVLSSKTRCQLIRGTIAMQVPPTAHGFTVAAPGFDVVDLGTGFGMTTDGALGGEVHVFEGSVEVRLADGDTLTVEAGEAIRILDGGLAFDRLTPAIFDYPIVADTPAERWAEMSQRLTLDADLAALITMDELPDEPSQLADRVDAQRTARVLGGTTVEGRFWETTALRFTEPTDGIAVNLPGALDAFTLGMWVKIDRLPDANAIASLIQTDTYANGDVHWNLDGYGRITLGIANGVIVKSDTVIDDAALGRWVHLAATYDSATGTATLYMDGRAIASRTARGQLPARLGPCTIGNWNNHSRPLAAAIDDLVVFERELNETEIRGIHDASNAP